jgi:hypothetical protein
MSDSTKNRKRKEHPDPSELIKPGTAPNVGPYPWPEIWSKLSRDTKAEIERYARMPEDHPKPKGLRPLAMVDARFPMYYQTSVKQGMSLLTDYFAAMASRDIKGVADTLHFPFATFDEIFGEVDPIVYKTADDFVKNPPPSMKVGTGDDATLKLDTYDILDNMQLLMYTPIHAGMELTYTRYRGDGQKLGTSQGIYGVTNNAGKWGIQLTSLLYTQEGWENVARNDVRTVQYNNERNTMWGYNIIPWPGVGSLQEMIDVRGLGGQVEDGEEVVQMRTANMRLPWTGEWLRSSRAGAPMSPYNYKGVKNRLLVAEPGTKRRTGGINGGRTDGILGNSGLIGDEETPGYFFSIAGQGMGRWAYSLPLHDSRVLHASMNKAHVIGGYVRFTADGHQSSELRSLGIMAYRRGRWGSVGGFGGMVRRDCTNDPIHVV